MAKPIIKEHNAATDEVIEREMTDEEFAQFEANKIMKAERKQAEAAQAEARTALLAKLGITADEAKLLLQ